MAAFGKASLAKLEGVHPDLVKVLKKAIIDTPVDFTIDQGTRTTAYQQSLYAKGRTTAGEIVTNADGVKNKSNHQIKSDGYGWAVDLYPYVNGKVQYNDVTNLRIISAHILATAKCMGIKVDWGGGWKTFKDYPHFELKK